MADTVMTITALGDGSPILVVTKPAILCVRPTMETNRKTVLQLLKRELAFLDSGGYKHHPRSSWRAPYIFEDSPSCPNSSDRARPYLCQECWLMQFVAPELREGQVPCRFVDLTGNGMTVDSFYRCGTPAESEEALRTWLQRHIHELELQLSQVRQLRLLSQGQR